jgi:hypothetical protein
MISFEFAALVISCIAITISVVSAVISIIVATYCEARQYGRLERPSKEDITGPANIEAGSKRNIGSSFQPISDRIRAISDPTPQAIAPKLKTPPKPAGGVGSKTGVEP